jgi:hypothetical protein
MENEEADFANAEKAAGREAAAAAVTLRVS